MSQQPWRIGYTPAARRDLRRLDPPVHERVIGAIERAAASDPRADIRKLAGAASSASAPATGESASPVTTMRVSS